MIENPDGTKRLPTKEEIINNVRQRRQQNSIENGNGSQIIRRPINDINAENRRSNNTGSGTSQFNIGTTQFDQRKYRPIERDTGGSNRSNDRVNRSTGQDGSDNNSSDEHIQRSTTNSEYNSSNVQQQQIKKTSKFKPYADAIKESVNRRTNTTNNQKTKTTHKVLSREELEGLRERLIEVILWQCDHTDELVQATTKGHLPVVIWQDMDKKDAGLLADFLIRRGRVDARIAHVVRELSIIRDRIQLGLIIVPRVYKTIMTYLERGISIR